MNSSTCASKGHKTREGYVLALHGLFTRSKHTHPHTCRIPVCDLSWLHCGIQLLMDVQSDLASSLNLYFSLIARTHKLHMQLVLSETQSSYFHRPQPIW